MSIDQDAVDLDASPRVPGGGPASRWRLARLTSTFAWTWLWLLVACAVAIVTVLLTSRGQGGITDGGLYTLLAVGMIALLLLCGSYAAGMAAVETRVDDDLREYALGRPVELVGKGGYHGSGADGVVSVDGRVVGERLSHPTLPDRFSGLAVGGRRHRVAIDGLDGGYTLAEQHASITPVVRMTDGDGRVVATATGHRRGHRQDWVLEAGGETLRWREHLARPVPRVTLLDASGRAWRVTFRRRTVRARLPVGLSVEASAFCVAVLAANRQRATLVSGTVGTGHGSGVDFGSDW